MKILYFHPWGIGDFLFVSNHLNIIKKELTSNIVILVNNRSTAKFIEEIYGYESYNFNDNYFKLVVYLMLNKFDIFIPIFGMNILKYKILRCFIRSHRSIPVSTYKDLCNRYYPDHRIISSKAIFNFLLPNLKFNSNYYISHSNKSEKLSDITIFIGSDKNQKYKRWPIDYWIKLLSLIQNNFKITMIYGPDELDYKSLFQHDNLIHIINPSYNVLITKIYESKLLISADCGIAHIASALNIKTITIFGPSDPNLFGPKNNSVAIINESFKCMPCISKNGLYGCKYAHCMWSIAVNNVYERIINEI
jgi:ADP-heptose:LPS heptosyltransferase